MFRLIPPCLLALTACLALAAPAPAEPPALKALAPAMRPRIDKLARAVEVENIPQESINLAGNATAFLISQTSLSVQEEANLAEQMREKILKQKRTIETPQAAERLLQRLLDQLPGSLETGGVPLPAHHP